MKKNKQAPEEEGESKNERWLLTYSDMITLLLALFIILYSMSNIEAQKVKQMAEGFSSAFHATTTDGAANGGAGDGTGDGGIGDAVASGTESEAGAGEGAGAGDGAGTAVNPLDEVYKMLSEYVDQNHLSSQIALVNADSYVQIRIKGVLMFVPDSPQMLDSSKPIIQKISEALAEVYDRVDHITISGNTADVGEHNPQTDAFSWYLSINRADTVRRSLVEYGLHEDKLSLEGYAHYNPVASNDTEEGRSQNRRAEITVYKYPSKG